LLKLKDVLKDKLSASELAVLVGGYDVVGDIAITIVPPELCAKEQLIGRTILQLNKRIKVVTKRVGNYGGEYRTISLKVIAGENRLATLHKENGVHLYLNLEQVYFSVRSSNERKRLAGLIQPGEKILVMFSGIGAFPLVIAKNSQAETITGIEKNHFAHLYALKNLAANKKIRNVTFIEGDVLAVVPRFKNQFDRVIMPLPKGGENFLGIGLAALKKDSWLHFYDFQGRESFSRARKKIKSAGKEKGLVLVESNTIICGHCGPQTYRLCVEAKISSRKL